MSFFQQKYALELSFDEISTLNLREFFFIFQENEQDLSTMMKFQVKKYFGNKLKASAECGFQPVFAEVPEPNGAIPHPIRGIRRKLDGHRLRQRSWVSAL